MSITVRYLHEYNKYKKQYGAKTLVLMQVGSFYELYATDTDGPKLKDIADLLNTVCTKKDKNVKDTDQEDQDDECEYYIQDIYSDNITCPVDYSEMTIDYGEIKLSANKQRISNA
jgi:hypothetical protein